MTLWLQSPGASGDRGSWLFHRHGAVLPCTPFRPSLVSWPHLTRKCSSRAAAFVALSAPSEPLPSSTESEPQPAVPPAMTPRTLPSLPDELIHQVLGHLDVPDLLSMSRTCHALRRLALDPHLHHRRLVLSSRQISSFLPSRPALSSIVPPRSGIYLSPTANAARRLNRNIIAIRLERKLSHRPCVGALVTWNILPRECCSGGGGLVSQRKRGLEREMLKAGLRVWLERKAREIRGRKSGEGLVGVLVWRFTRWIGREERERKAVIVEGEGRVEGLRTFWEGVGAR